MSIAGAGAWVLALALDFGSAAWPEILKPHPHLVIALGVAGAIMLCAPLVQYFFPIFKDEVSQPLCLKMQIDDVYMARPGGDYLVFAVGEFFLLVSSELAAPRSASVTYALEIIQQGKAVAGEWTDDIEEWVRAAKINDLTRAGDSIPMHLMDGLPVQYRCGEKRDGWLHFKIPAMRESDVRECTLRVFAKSKYGTSTCEKKAGTWPITRKDFKIVKKPIPDPTPKAFHDLLTMLRLLR